MRKLFELQTDLKNYTYTLSKIFISVLIILFCIFRDRLFTISAKPLNFVVTFLCLVITVASILCIYVAVIELLYVRKNRRNRLSKYKHTPAIPYDFEKVKCLVKENDIIEFEIKTTESIIKIGSSSNCKIDSSVFFDKSFYIGGNEYLTLEEFEDELLKYAVNGKLSVITIDGVKADEWQ